jgi:hypothetical protein
VAAWPAGRFGERWRSLVESAVVLLLVDSLLRCSFDASVVVTVVTDGRDASVPKVRIFILLSLGGALTNGRWGCRGSADEYRLRHCGRLPQVHVLAQLCDMIQVHTCMQHISAGPWLSEHFSIYPSF